LQRQGVAFRSAVTFLTRLPVGTCGCTLPASAAGYFPAVGTLVGLIGALTWRVTTHLDSTVRAWLVTAVLLLVTGAFHEDGLADTADALGGAFDRKRLFEILKDSRIGSFGAVALITVIALRSALWRQVLQANAATLIVSQTLSRLPPVLMLRSLPYVTPAPASRSHDVTALGATQVGLAAMWCVGVLAIYGVAYRVWIPIVAAVVAQGLVSAWLAYRFVRRAGGLTGDFLGTTQQLGELAFLLAFAWLQC
jgi:adenosylcobinamide-GDP ribazoletransferase